MPDLPVTFVQLLNLLMVLQKKYHPRACTYLKSTWFAVHGLSIISFYKLRLFQQLQQESNQTFFAHLAIAVPTAHPLINMLYAGILLQPLVPFREEWVLQSIWHWPLILVYTTHQLLHRTMSDTLIIPHPAYCCHLHHLY